MKNDTQYQLEAALEQRLVCEGMLSPEELLSDSDKEYAARYDLSYEDMVAFKRDMEEILAKEEHEEEMKYRKEMREYYNSPQYTVHFAW